MHSDKKITKEDTWRPSDLRRHIRESEYGDRYVKKRGDHEKKLCGGESTERRHRDLENEFKQEGERHRERESRGRRDEETRYAEQRKAGSQDRRRDKEAYREKRMERYDMEKKYLDDYRENRESRRDREGKHRDSDKEKHRDKKKEILETDRREDRDKEKREKRHEERTRDERDREQRHEKERRRTEHSGEGRRDETRKHHREHKDPRRERHRDEGDRQNEVQKRHEDRKDPEQRQRREFSDDTKHKEERERRHKERSHHDERQRHSNEQWGLKGSVEEVRNRRDDREQLEKEGRHRDEKETERKNKERRHKEEEDAERKHSQRRRREDDDVRRKQGETRHKEKEEISRRNQNNVASSNPSPTDKAEEVFSENWREDVRDKEDTAESAANDDESAEEEYEDDFEDYEDDFEDVDDNDGEEDEEEEVSQQEDERKEEISTERRKEIEEIQRAIEEENERVGTTQLRQSSGREEEETHKRPTGSEVNQGKAPQKGRFMDFVAAKKREVNKQAATKQKKRSTELLRLIDLDFSLTFSLLELSPVNEYDMYIRNFGTTNTKQAYVQCNEDNADRDIQTEEIEIRDMWTQHPPEHNRACGDPNLSQEAQDKGTYDSSFDTKRLTSFLRSASQVMVVLLEEDRAERNSLRKLKTHTDTLSFSDGSVQLNTKLPFLHGRKISLVHFSQVQRHTMLSVHMPTDKPSAVPLDSCTIICIWNIWEPSRPQKILIYESEVQCCCFSPGKATLVFAGTSVGSVVLWDLREHTSNHHRSIMGEEEWTFRQPTFSTDAVMACSGHSSCVTSVEVLPSSVDGGQRLEVPLLTSEEESLGLSFQLASLDENGVLNFWVVLELSKGNEAGSLTDLGLRPGGKVKLLHSACLQTAERPSPREAAKTAPTQTLLLKFLPTDCNHFFIGTNMGVVHHRTSHGIKARPKLYRFQEMEVRPVNVSSIHFSPFKPHLFLVGCENGSVRLHTVSREQPVAEWADSTAGEPVVSVQWANTRPTVFCVLDAASNIHIWDLLRSDAEPVLTERASADRVTAMAIFGDSGRKYSGIALAHKSGKIVMQYFTGNLTVSSSAEEEKLETMTTEAF